MFDQPGVTYKPYKYGAISTQKYLDLFTQKKHIVFKVNDLSIAMQNPNIRILCACREISPGYKVGVIEDSGIVTEFVETSLGDDEIAKLISDKMLVVTVKG